MLLFFMRRATIINVKATATGIPSGMNATTHPTILVSDE
jgi:hypothetical protein